jgi:transposase
MIGLDIAKNVFQVHGVDGSGEVVVRKRLRRGEVVKFFTKCPPSIVGLEACGGAHHWCRVLAGLGHEVRLMPAAYVKPYVKRNKTDSRDAEAICEAMVRPGMRFVARKSVEQQAVLGLHRTRALLVRQRTMHANALRALFTEFGVVASPGIKGLRVLLAGVPGALPPEAEFAAAVLVRQWQGLTAEIEVLTDRIVAAAKADEVACRLMAIPGVGPMGASAIVAAVSDARQFRSGRSFAAWLGLTPRQNNSGDKRRSGGISKQGDRHIRTQLILGASAHLRQLRGREHKDPWLAKLITRRPIKVAAVARAAKTARIIRAMLVSGQPYRAPVRLTA